MASPDRNKRKVLKARKTMPVSCRKQVEFLNTSKNIEAVGSNIPNGNQNLNTKVINSKCRHSENIDYSLDHNKNSEFSLKTKVFSPNLINRVEEIVDSDSRLENIDEQVVCHYQKPKKATDSLRKFPKQKAKDSQNTSDTNFQHDTNVSRSFFEHEENRNLNPICCLPTLRNDIVQNTLDDNRIHKMVSNLEPNSNSDSDEKRQNDILKSDSGFVPVEKTPNLMKSVGSSNCATTISKTDESRRACHSSISNCEHADSKWQSLIDIDSSDSHNKKKRMFSENKENVKRMKISQQINENICVVQERQTALLEQVRHLIRQEIYSINYKLFDKKLNELNERIGKTQCRNKHEAIAGELFLRIARLRRRIKTVLPQRNCLEPKTLSSNTACKIASSETMNSGKNQESVNNPNERTTPVNYEPYNLSEKERERINLSPDCVEFVSESNDDVMLISVESPNLTTPITSNLTVVRKDKSRNSRDSPNAAVEVQAVEKKKLDFAIDLTTEGLSSCNTESPTFTWESPSKAVLNSKEITPAAENGAEEVESFEHLPPLPEPPPLLPELVDKIRDTLPPQKPELKVKRVLRPLGIVLTWNITKINPKCAPVESYHLFLCHEKSKNKLIWKKIGEIKALPLPMACTLSQFLSSNKYYFTVQSKDIFGRYGPFCDIQCIPGFSEIFTS